MADSDYSTSSLAAKAAQLQSAEDSETEQKELAEEGEVGNSSKQDMRKIPEVPDYPSCDYCGEEFAGKLFCSQCRSAYYCSKECQKKHWKAPNGHKANCLKMEERYAKPRRNRLSHYAMNIVPVYFTKT
ncbi:peptidase C19, ubiquitin carboxyl-terminal hydrolase 2 [Chaetoceros tenuissimus]|uniref:Peptidase C19, ubiquitin carboxyl-terminal hydrolase 2 n=1 Tax=Chaetoceros tenuissimus TaxID=426638 RepID=A0AAD3CPY2_9STRA|nr:peptidase C19, ubiquitin carboxyl-terminal hydrolase 2 [Chaetoceros tenuissimus]GFH50007.1 peptidase C19, ubiquitin carboxyl-terminal hydrolase 2 [Chaetoceros tenuissimus]